MGSGGFGQALMQMELHEKEQDVHPEKHITKRYVQIDARRTVSPRILAVILSFGKVFPALLAGDTVVLRPARFTTLTLLRISEHIRELLFVPANANENSDVGVEFG
jgi:acyl-CoA reductase-like NAD-dependent aldehyde dehydrogenase